MDHNHNRNPRVLDVGARKEIHQLDHEVATVSAAPTP